MQHNSNKTVTSDNNNDNFKTIKIHIRNRKERTERKNRKNAYNMITNNNNKSNNIKITRITTTTIKLKTSTIFKNIRLQG